MNNKTEYTASPSIGPRTPYEVTVDTKCGAAPIYDSAGVAKFDLRRDDEAARPADSPEAIAIDQIAEKLREIGVPPQRAISVAESIHALTPRAEGASSASSDPVDLIHGFISGIAQSVAREKSLDQLTADLLCVPIFRLATCSPSAVGYTNEDLAQRIGVSQQAVRDFIDELSNAFGVQRPGATPPATRRKISRTKILRNRDNGIFPKQRPLSGKPPGPPQKWTLELLSEVVGSKTIRSGKLKERLMGAMPISLRTAGRVLKEAQAAGVLLKTPEGFRQPAAAPAVPPHSQNFLA